MLKSVFLISTPFRLPNAKFITLVDPNPASRIGLMKYRFLSHDTNEALSKFGDKIKFSNSKRAKRKHYLHDPYQVKGYFNMPSHVPRSMIALTSLFSFYRLQKNHENKSFITRRINIKRT